MKTGIALAVPLALIACQDGELPPPEGYSEDNVIGCRSGGAADFAPECGMERSVEDGETILTVRHPDGHFRRFSVQADGSGVRTADGSETAQQRLVDGMLEVEVGGDAYRFPAKPAADAAVD